MLLSSSFRPWNPRTWPPIHKLIALAPLVPILRLVFKSSDDQQFQPPLSPLITATASLLVIFLLVKLKSFINKRHELMKLFDQGGVPSVSNRNLFSGNIFQVIVPPNNILIIDKYHEKLGKTWGMFYGPDPWIFTTDLDLLQKLFVSEGHKYIDITQFRMPFMQEFNRSLAQIQGEEWRTMRRSLNPSFAHKQLKSDNVFENIEKVCDKLLNCIHEHPLTNSKGELEEKFRVVDVNYNFKKYAIEVIFRVAYGQENGVNMRAGEQDPLIEIVNEASELIRGPIAWISIMFDSSQRALGALGRFTPLGSCINYIHNVLDGSIRKRRKMGKKIGELERKMIDSIVENFDSRKIDDNMLKSNLFFIFIAGFETSANTLAIMFWLLAQHQDIQEKLRLAVASEGSEAEYLDWCVRETLRLYPAVPTAVGRVLPDDIEFKGMKLYKGTTVNASIFSIHHSVEYWGQDVEEFRPERFAAANLHPLQYFAFGHGPRYCLGANLAKIELKAIVPQILLKYRVGYCDTTPEKLNITSPNMIHMIIHGTVDLKFTEISSL